MQIYLNLKKHYKKGLNKLFFVFISLFYLQYSNAQVNDNFLKYESEKLDYYSAFRGEEYKERILKDKEEALKEQDSIIYDTYIFLDSFCDIDFYRFSTLGAHADYHIAMIDNEKNTIAFLDTLTLNQTMDSITNVLKNCEQQASPKELFEFYDRIKGVYKYNESIGINLIGSYSSPSQTVVYLLSAENALDFDKAKRYIDIDKVYESQEEWEQKVRVNPPSLDFHNYWFTVKENGRYATVTTRYKEQKTKYYLRQERYYSKSWKIVGIESD